MLDDELYDGWYRKNSNVVMNDRTEIDEVMEVTMGTQRRKLDK